MRFESPECLSLEFARGDAPTTLVMRWRTPSMSLACGTAFVRLFREFFSHHFPLQNHILETKYAIMSEESKTPDADYVHMGPGGSGMKLPKGMDDPNLSQEDRDMRLALALQQQENAAAFDAHKKKHQAAVAANTNRTTRSNVHTRLANVRDKDGGMLSVPAAYTTENAYVSGGNGDYLPPVGTAPPAGASAQEVADYNLAASLQKVEAVTVGTGAAAEKILKEDMSEADAQAHRTGHSNYHINQKGLPFKRDL